MEIKSGFLLINKPVGISSYGCINHIKSLLRQYYGGKVKQKIGHAGTLDPFASGLLIVAIGRHATRLLSQCMVMEKTYIATGKCGELTDTLDLTGTIIATSAIIPSELALRLAFESFGLSYEQIPPLYSALKYQGTPLYLLTRKKIIQEDQLQEIAINKKRIVQLYEKEFVSYNPPFFTIKVRASHGTYVRTLINDIAVKAGSCATTYELQRTNIGPFSLDKAVDVFSLTSTTINDHIIGYEAFFD